MAKNTRGSYFPEASKAFKRGDVLGAWVLAALGIVAPLADPVSDMIERWGRAGK